jgi:hypothetical protein
MDNRVVTVTRKEGDFPEETEGIWGPFVNDAAAMEWIDEWENLFGEEGKKQFTFHIDTLSPPRKEDGSFAITLPEKT